MERKRGKETKVERTEIKRKSMKGKKEGESVKAGGSARGKA